jgi:ATP-dependent helicase HrpB
MRACERTTQRLGLLALPLHGDLPPEEQDRAVLPAPQRKAVFSTNVAESSLTIGGVTTVIDSGLARIPRDSVHTGLPELAVVRISQASATQRAGRAGRTRPGRVIRLYPLEDFLRRPAHDTPEILRRELSGLCLELDEMEVPDVRALPWIDPPPEPSLAAARALLARLGAHGADAREMARLPLHPRLSAMLVEARRRNAGEIACLAAAWLSSGDRPPAPVNLLDLLESDPPYSVRRTLDQLQRLTRPERHSKSEEGLALAILRGFPDRVRKSRDGRLLAALDIEERPGRPEPLIRLFLPLQPEMLIEMFPDRIEERRGVEWRRAAERAESVDALLYEGLPIQETRGGPIDPEAAARLLAEKALEAGITRFTDAEALDAYRKRREFAGLPVSESELRETLASLAAGLKSFTELAGACRDGAFLAALDARLSPQQKRRLDEYAPARLKLPSGRSAPIRYESGKPPVASARLQEFFGMRETPRIAGGDVPLLLELLAPNMRPVQTTTDLAGFWQRLYPQLRKELGRRYPKHSWPEDPLAASPPARR